MFRLLKITAALIPALLWAADLPGAKRRYDRCDFDGALAALNAKASRDPEVLALAGRSHYFLGNYKNATEFLELAVRLSGGNAEYHLWLGRAYGRRAETSSFLTAPSHASRCRQHFEKAVELDPANLEALNDLQEYYMEAPGILGGGMDKAVRIAGQIASVNQAEGHFAQARLAEKRQDHTRAEADLRRAAELEPDKQGRWIELARFHARRGRTAEAEDALSKAAGVAPDSPRLLYARAEILIRLKRNLDEARSLLERYLRSPLTPDDPPRRDAEKLLSRARAG